MNISTEAPSYILGQSNGAEHRLELLNELTTENFVIAMSVLPKKKVCILNIGCGSGHLEARLSEMFSDSHFIGIDVSAKRIEEARARIAGLKSSNSFDFIQADLTAVSMNELKPCDILISRFVLSHLPDPIIQLNRFLSLVRPGGYVCFEEGASNGSEYYCNNENKGYRDFLKMIDIQIKSQKSSFDVAFSLLTELTQRPCKVLYSRLEQAILRSARHKSILRLGLEEAKSTLLKGIDQGKLEQIILSLQQFEEDELAYGLYMRFLAVIAQKL